MAYAPLQNAVKCLHLKPLELSHLERERERERGLFAGKKGG
jgi:hypothetical protein